MTRYKSKEYLLMHLNKAVLSFEVDEDMLISKINKIFEKERVPPGLGEEKIRKGQLEEWFYARSISENRTNFKDILKYHNVKYKKELFFKDNSVSASDCYWIQQLKEHRRWEDINFYDNLFEFNENIYIGITEAQNKLNTVKIQRNSPNIMSNGNVPKMWIQKKGQLYLIKGSQSLSREEPINEKIVSDFLDTININHVQYTLNFMKKRAFSICKSMLHKGEELIPAYYIASMEKNEKKRFTYKSYMEKCIRLIKNKEIKKELENMLVIDFLCSNTDRHWFNFGVIRDAQTLKITKLAPLYDHGLSFFANTDTEEINKIYKKVKSGSFCEYLKDNLNLVTESDIFSDKEIKTLKEIYKTGLETVNYTNTNRKRLIEKSILFNINYLKKHKKARIIDSNN
jgi:hypothetical protein